jgi:hypothetical protein
MNYYDIAKQIDEATVILREAFKNIVEFNMGSGELNCDTFPQMKDSVDKLNETTDKINRLVK